jgi:hypothetical protein
MARTITLSLPHNLGEQEAKRRLVSGIADARQKYPQFMRGASDTWSGNRMDFCAAAMGQTINGHVDVLPRSVNISIDLPFVLAMIAERLRPQIESEGRKLLGVEPEKSC